MTASALGSWEPLDLDAAVDVFSSADFRWWIGGGHALDLHVGRTWRVHEDTDIGVVRAELGALRALLSGWDLHVAAGGRLSAWRGEPLAATRHQNNVWCRRGPDGPWALDITIGEGTGVDWIFRRDPTIRAPWDRAVLRTPHGVPYLAPELQLLFKSKDPRPKDDIDAAEVIPALDVIQRTFLAGQLEPDHPWQQLLNID